MKLEKSSDYKYYFFDKDKSILYHEINEENCGTEEKFIISMSYFVTLIDEFRPKSIIIKILKKPDYFELKLNYFMQQTFYKLAKALHIRKVAFFIYNDEYFNELLKYESNNLLKVKFFLDIEEAKHWVMGPD